MDRGSRQRHHLSDGRPHWCFHRRPAQLLPWPKRRNLPHGLHPHFHPDRLRFRQVMARPLRCTVCPGYRYWCKERHGPYLFGRDGPGSHSRCPCHVLAAVGGGRHLLRLLRQCHCQRYWSHILASSARFSLYPIFHPRSWYFLLSRVASLAYEA